MILGIDPGTKTTGFCLITNAGETKAWGLSHREKEESIYDYAEALIARAKSLTFGRNCVMAIEDMRPPVPQLGMISVKPHIETGKLIGALWIGLDGYERVIVQPKRHGSHTPLWLHYPDELIGDRENPDNGKGKLRHCRSAFDIAKAAGGLR